MENEGRFYLDTSIWLDFLEDRGNNGDAAYKLLKFIINRNYKIIFSEAIKDELLEYGLSMDNIRSFLSVFKRNVICLYVNKKQFRKAKDISNKRNIPVFDALHAIIARDNSAVMITRDRHFDKLLDIVRYKKPEEIII
jgi:predicted nucleic acid-binding protein